MVELDALRRRDPQLAVDLLHDERTFVDKDVVARLRLAQPVVQNRDVVQPLEAEVEVRLDRAICRPSDAVEAHDLVEPGDAVPVSDLPHFAPDLVAMRPVLRMKEPDGFVEGWRLVGLELGRQRRDGAPHRSLVHHHQPAGAQRGSDLLRIRDQTRPEDDLIPARAEITGILAFEPRQPAEAPEQLPGLVTSLALAARDFEAQDALRQLRQAALGMFALGICLHHDPDREQPPAPHAGELRSGLAELAEPFAQGREPRRLSSTCLGELVHPTSELPEPVHGFPVDGQQPCDPLTEIGVVRRGLVDLAVDSDQVFQLADTYSRVGSGLLYS